MRIIEGNFVSFYEGPNLRRDLNKGSGLYAFGGRRTVSGFSEDTFTTTMVFELSVRPKDLKASPIYAVSISMMDIIWYILCSSQSIDNLGVHVFGAHESVMAIVCCSIDCRENLQLRQNLETLGK
jgi:hypothetical protein